MLLSLHTYVRDTEGHYAELGVEAQKKMDKIIGLLENSDQYEYDAAEFKKKCFNENLSSLVRNSDTEDRIIEYKNRFIRKIDPIFYEPPVPENILNYRTHLFSPVKYLFGIKFDTFWFNIMVIWSMTIMLYLFLYFDLMQKIVNIRLFKRK